MLVAFSNSETVMDLSSVNGANRNLYLVGIMGGLNEGKSDLILASAIKMKMEQKRIGY